MNGYRNSGACIVSLGFVCIMYVLFMMGPSSLICINFIRKPQKAT